MQGQTSLFSHLSTVCQHSTTEDDQNLQTLCALQEVVRPLQLDERMIALAAAISIDFDYFSQHSHGPGRVPHPKDQLMLCVVSSCHAKASDALLQHIAGHLGLLTCKMQPRKLADRLWLQNASVDSKKKMHLVACRHDARLPVPHADPSARVPSARRGRYPNRRA